MSYQRSPYPLTYFKEGETQYYVFFSTDDHMEDYGATYDDAKALVELTIDVMKREVPDKRWLLRMLHALSKKMGIEDQLKSDEEILEALS